MSMTFVSRSVTVNVVPPASKLISAAAPAGPGVASGWVEPAIGVSPPLWAKRNPVMLPLSWLST